ncbi:unnamed protein product [Soboliphyme baturini]|uniref:Secreted protein n=1 Tax=Soboliphyme baturini TaxID=241478 RepID=A0A183IAS5_9BILA|nr:unnamed protein product [Soboliphyme baturini]
MTTTAAEKACLLACRLAVPRPVLPACPPACPPACLIACLIALLPDHHLRCRRTARLLHTYPSDRPTDRPIARSLARCRSVVSPTVIDCHRAVWSVWQYQELASPRALPDSEFAPS